MRSSLFLGLLVLALILFGGPYLTGSQLAQWHVRWSADGSHSKLPGLPEGWQVTQSSLQRGWFSSELDLSLLPPAGACGAQPCTPLITQSRIHHGPLALGALPAAQALWPALAVATTGIDSNALLSGSRPNPPLPPATVVTRVGFSGRAGSNLHLPASSHVLRNGSTIEQSGISGYWADHGVRDYALSASAMTLETTSGIRLGLSDIQLTQAEDAQHLSAQSASLQRGEEPGLMLSDLELDLNLEQQGVSGTASELFNSQIELQLKQLSQGNRGIGPLQLSLKAERLAAAPLRELQSRLGMIYGRQLPPHLQSMALQGVLASQLPALTRAGPHLAIEELRVGQGKQEISAQLDLRLQPQVTGAANLLAFIHGIDLTAEAEVPAHIAEAAAGWRAAQLAQQDQAITPAELLEQWRGNGLLVAVGERYRSVWRLADARLTINGDESKAWNEWLAKLEAQQTQQQQQEGLAGQHNWPRKPPPDDSAAETPQP